ncbi:MAG: N-acetylmuramoyl-L-alanine amidase [Eubacteriales bacterium]|nr:N-acetylmuramoyl-L-alanine amidase [Eubacteriales bacterium]
MGKGKSWVLVYLLTALCVLLAACLGSRAVTVIAENTPVRREHCIVIDPGHGGEDGGATSCTGRLESAYNLEIALRLNDLLHLLGYDTRMLRTTDTSIYVTGDTIAQKKISDLKERVRIVNETENALLLSIHQNQFSDSRYSGAQVFYPNTPGSQQLAKQMQTALVSALNPGSSRKSKPCKGVYVMEHIRCPGVLVECGFLSNLEEEGRLRDRGYQQRLCCVIAASAIQFLTGADSADIM